MTEPCPPHLSCDKVWQAIDRSSFAVLSHVTSAGEPRSSGIVYGTAGRHLFVVVAGDSLKARTIAEGQLVSVTIPVRRGGILSLLIPIPPATISFRARASVRAAGSRERESLPARLQRLLPPSRDEAICIIELAPEGQFLTYGIGVSLARMRDPQAAGARVPVA